jgi:hypothetical protein
MSKPKGACDNPFSGTGTYADAMKNTRFPGEDPKAKEDAAKAKDQAMVTDMLALQNGDKPKPPVEDKPAVEPKPIEAKVAEAVIAGKTFEAGLKKEMINLVMDNDMVVDEVTDKKITFTKDGKKFVIVPI